MEGRWRRQNLEPGLARTVRTRAVLWQLASDGVWCKLLVAIVLSLRLGLLRGSFCYKFGALFCSSQSWPMTGALACLFWLWWVGGGSMPCFVWHFWPR